MRIPDDYKKSVVFFGIAAKGSTPENLKINYRGTGFIISVPSRQHKGQNFIYLITAKHVVVDINGREFFVRANKKDGDAIVFTGDSNARWWYHPNEAEASDVAVFRLPIPQNIFNTMDCALVPEELILTDEKSQKENIGAGDEVFIVGLFSYHSGSRKNLPIIRMGNIAMMSDANEPVQTSAFGNMEAYLIEARSFGGMSGSPVFVTKEIALGRTQIHLLGLIHGHWDISPEKIMDSASEDAGSKPNVNLGIAIVAPAKKILETIYRAELVEDRAQLEAKMNAKKTNLQ
jgi:hypothetical protein